MCAINDKYGKKWLILGQICLKKIQGQFFQDGTSENMFTFVKNVKTWQDKIKNVKSGQD